MAELGLASVNPWHNGARLDYRLMWKHLYGVDERDVKLGPRNGGAGVWGGLWEW